MWVIICLQMEYRMVVTVHVRWIERKPLEAANRGSIALQLGLYSYFSRSVHFSLQSLKVRKQDSVVDVREASSLTLQGMCSLLDLVAIKYYNHCISVPDYPTTLKNSSLRNTGGTESAVSLVDITFNVKQGSDAEQNTATVQCHCLPALLLKKCLVENLDLLVCWLLPYFFFPLPPTQGLISTFLVFPSLIQASDLHRHF